MTCKICPSHEKTKDNYTEMNQRNQEFLNERRAKRLRSQAILLVVWVYIAIFLIGFQLGRLVG